MDFIKKHKKPHLICSQHTKWGSSLLESSGYSRSASSDSAQQMFKYRYHQNDAAYTITVFAA